MSWIKRLLQKFLREDVNRDDDDQVIRSFADTYSRQMTAENEREPNREIEARVLYKYPKGQFKFPLIPDSDEPIEKEREKREKSSAPAYSEELSHSPEPEGLLVEDRPATNYKHQKSLHNQKPFRPTEIPSPIYAFKRPTISDEPVEYELTDLTTEAKVDKVRIHHTEQAATLEQVQNVQVQKDHEELAQEDTEEKMIHYLGHATLPDKKMIGLKNSTESIESEKSIGFVEEQSEVKVEAVSVAPENRTKQQEAVIGEENPGLELENGNDVIKAVGLERQYDEVICEPIEREEDEDFSERGEMKQLGLEAPGIAEQEDKALDQEEKVFEITEAGNQVAESETLLDETNAEQDESSQTANLFEEIEEISFNSVNDDQLKQEDTDRNDGSFSETSKEVQQIHLEEKEGTVETKPKKNIVPFNVLMLKKDKRNLEKQREKVREAQSHENRPILNRTTDNNEGLESDELMEPEASYQFPPLDLLNPPVQSESNGDWLYEQEKMLDETLKNFNVGAKVVNVTQGPAVTRFEVQPEPGVKVNKITNLSDDIKLSLAARDIRIEAPIPGKHTIGIEVPNANSRPVLISEILKTSGFKETESPLAVALGLDIAGTPIVTDLKKMPHGLIAGATGSGKSVCINSMLVSLLYKSHPNDVKLLLIDPKMVELAPYNHIPHLVSPVITDVKAATASLKWAVEEMERRYELFAHSGVRDITRFNELAIEHKRYAQKLPYIVIVIDELADLMMMSPADVEEAISRIAQKARACGIHLIIATQRPSVDVITGLIKANVPTRIAFSVSSQVDSRTIIDISGAEKLLGRGDMLFLESGSSKPYRLQGTFVSDREIDDVVAFVREQRSPNYLFEQEELLKKSQIIEEEDELFYEACVFVIEQGGASTSSVQRKFKIGYNRAARLIDMMEQNGFISEARGSKPRDVLISLDELEAFQ